MTSGLQTSESSGSLKFFPAYGVEFGGVRLAMNIGYEEFFRLLSFTPIVSSPSDIFRLTSALDIANKVHSGKLRRSDHRAYFEGHDLPLLYNYLFLEMMQYKTPEIDKLIAVALHDVVEDGGGTWTINNIGEEFGEDVGRWVGYLTKSPEEKASSSPSYANRLGLALNSQGDEWVVDLKALDNTINMLEDNLASGSNSQGGCSAQRAYASESYRAYRILFLRKGSLYSWLWFNALPNCLDDNFPEIRNLRNHILGVLPIVT